MFVRLSRSSTVTTGNRDQASQANHPVYLSRTALLAHLINLDIAKRTARTTLCHPWDPCTTHHEEYYS